nr:MAG TPA: hypothetical protein [Bacteriophage sp.]
MHTLGYAFRYCLLAHVLILKHRWFCFLTFFGFDY